MNTGQMIRRVQLLFGDSAEAQITIAFIIDCLNDGQMDVARKTGVLNKRVQTSSVSQDGSYALPPDLLYLNRVTFDDIPLTRTTLEQKDIDFPEYDKNLNSGTPKAYFIYGKTLFLIPIPDSSGTGNLDLWYTKIPIFLTNSDDISELPVTYHEDIVRYALMRCKESDDDFETAEKISGDLGLRMSDSMQEAFDPFEDSYPAIRAIPGD